VGRWAAGARAVAWAIAGPALIMGQPPGLRCVASSRSAFTPPPPPRSPAGFASNHQDISSRYAAVLFGITNALSSLMGTCSVYGTGLILEATGSWELVFSLVAGFYVFGAVGYLAWASSEQQFE